MGLGYSKGTDVANTFRAFEKWQNIVDVVVDGGYGDNVASTVIDFSSGEATVIREGKGSLDIL